MEDLISINYYQKNKSRLSEVESPDSLDLLYILGLSRGMDTENMVHLHIYSAIKNNELDRKSVV